jgi:hypothetical protein
MNDNRSPETSSAFADRASADAIQRRAYELWENEGRPEGSDMRHWLQAEQELSRPSAGNQGNGSDSQNANGGANRYTDIPQARPPSAESRGSQTSVRSGAIAGRDGKRSGQAPLSAEKTGASTPGGLKGQDTARRRA